METSSIVSVGALVDKFGAGKGQTYPSALVRLGFEFGNIDGGFGPKTKRLLAQLILSDLLPSELKAKIDSLLQERYPHALFGHSTDTSHFVKCS